jgi:hypothetical protein
VEFEVEFEVVEVVEEFELAEVEVVEAEVNIELAEVEVVEAEVNIELAEVCIELAEVVEMNLTQKHLIKMKKTLCIIHIYTHAL